MLDTPHSLWLPLQPLPAAPPSTPAAALYTPIATPANRSDTRRQHERALPGCSCSIEALRDTFTPLYYHPATAAPLPVITQASTRDLPALVKLHSLSLPLKYNPSFFISLLLNANYIVLVARPPSDNNAVIACATAFFNPYDHKLELLTLCVDQKHQRFGLATALLRQVAIKALEASRQTSFTASLRVQTTNKPAISLYSSLGFIIEEMEANYYKGCLSGTKAAYRMTKLITNEQ